MSGKTEKTYWWLIVLFIIGNTVFANVFANLFALGILGLPLGVGVSGALTLIALFILRQRERAHKILEARGLSP
ncbi:MAG: hypothetical protein ACE5IJ_07310 [Thermoplasmata archaeon]